MEKARDDDRLSIKTTASVRVKLTNTVRLLPNYACDMEHPETIYDDLLALNQKVIDKTTFHDDPANINEDSKDKRNKYKNVPNGNPEIRLYWNETMLHLGAIKAAAIRGIAHISKHITANPGVEWESIRDDCFNMAMINLNAGFDRESETIKGHYIGQLETVFRDLFTTVFHNLKQKQNA